MNGVTVTGATQLEARLHAVQRAPQTMMGVLARRVVQQSKLLAPHKTGNLRRTIRVAAETKTSAIVVAGANYAGFVEHGTGPHVITPNAKKALAFASQGITAERFGAGAILKFNKTGSLSAGSMRKYGNAAFVVVKKVHHPGTKAQPFLLPGAEKAIAEGGLTQTIVAAWNAA